MKSVTSLNVSVEKLNHSSVHMQMTNPAIQNDFSYYRRTISRNRLNNQQVRGVQIGFILIGWLFCLDQL